ncbi:MAG: hypothetical protein K5907_06575 [Treponema sp.]|nr:hypothetical protein [Treponema sp.]
MKLCPKTNTEFADAIGIAIIVSMMFIPLNGKGNILRLLIASSLYIHQFIRHRLVKSEEVKNILILMIISSLLPLFASALCEPYIYWGAWIHEFQRMIFLCILIPLCYSYKADRDYILYICLIVLCINFLIQIMQWLHIGNINDWIIIHYASPDSNLYHLGMAKYKGASFRSGSIFMNPNVYMVIPATILCIIVQKNLQKPNPINYIWIGITIFSMLLTGSRTAFIVSVILLFFSIYKDKSSSNIKWFLPIICIILLIFYSSSLENFRFFKVQKGIQGSASGKAEWFFLYFRVTKFIYLFTGSLGSGIFTGIDAEWGYIYAWFGIIGMIWYIKFIKLIGKNRYYFPFQTLAFQSVISLIAMTASVVLCMPMCPFFCIITLIKMI